MPRPSDLVAIVLIAGTALGAAIDLRTRRVPNPLTLSLAAAGVLLAAAGFSGLSIWASLAGLALGLALMLPGHLIGATGAGDVKLFAAAGAFIGPSHVIAAFIYTALAGGAIAILVSLWRRRLMHTVGETALLIASAGRHAAAIEHPAVDNRFAYAPAIAVGTMLVALGF